VSDYSNTLDMVELILTYIDPKCIDIDCTSRWVYLSIASYFNRNGTSHKLISASELTKHLTTSQCPFSDATNNGDCLRLLHILISALELSKHLTISMFPWFDPINNADSLERLHLLISA
jgi:hypothetical protein